MMKLLQAFWKFFKTKQPVKSENLPAAPSPSDTPDENFEPSLILSPVSFEKSKYFQLPDVEHGKEKTPDSPAGVAKNKAEQSAKSSPMFVRKTKKVHIQVGIDFGTSATKIAFSQIGKRPIRVLTFNHKLPHYPPFCIPSIACINEDGRLLFGVTAARWLLNKEWDDGLQRLKIVIAGKYEDRFEDQTSNQKYYEHFALNERAIIEPEVLTAIFLAYVMRLSRIHIKKFPEYRDQDLAFATNICMPIDHVENSRLKPVFEKMFACAELIADQWDYKDEGFDPFKVAAKFDTVEPLNKSKVFAVPESVASFASYLVSLRKKEGLHAVIDLGSGTTDLSICNLLLDSGTYWYAARNLNKGTIAIERSFINTIVDRSKGDFCNPDKVYKYLSLLSSASENGKNMPIREIISGIVLKELCQLRDSKEYKRTWGEAYGHFKKDRLWEEVEIFLCGGGSNLPHANQVFSKPWWGHIKSQYKVGKLPVPDNYAPGESNAPFERMSVAYGLAIPFPQLNDFILPNDSPDHTPMPEPVLELDRDDLYPKD